MQVDWAPKANADFRTLLESRGVEDDDETHVAEAPSEDSSFDSAKKCISVRPFESRAALRRALEGTLALDIRSPVQRERHPNSGLGPTSSGKPFFVGDLWFHELHVTYALLPADAC